MNNSTGDDRFTQSYTTPEQDTLPGDLAPICRYWNSLCNDRAMPTWAEWDWSQLSPNIKSWSAVVDVIPLPLDFTYSFSGEGRNQLLGNDYTGQSVLDITPAVISNKILKEYATVVERRAPLLISTFGFGQSQNKAYNLLRLPFGNGEQVEQILSTCSQENADLSAIYALFGTHNVGHTE
ncbi:MAG: hypothetical protein JJ855_01650 [Rhodospirillales bacterium]|nr:hypothetical protein [Rhodospirillales bacterium]